MIARTPHTLRFEPAELAEVKQAVSELTEAVGALKARATDAKTDERIEALKGDLEERLRALDAKINEGRSGFDVELVAAGHGLPALRRAGRELPIAERLAFMHTLPVKAAARWSRRPVELIEDFHRASDDLVMLGTILGFQAQQKGASFDVRETRYYNEEFLPSLHAAMDSTTAAEGDEFVPLELSGSLVERVNLQLRVLALFENIDMPTQPYEMPAFPVARKRLGSHAEQTADSGQTKFKAVTPGTRKISFDAKKFAGRILVSRELEEDSIVPILAWIRREIVDYLVADLEDTAINGDTAGTHQDTDTTDADDPRKNWEGLRQLTNAGAKTDASAVALSVAMLRANRKKMGKYAVSPSDLAHVLSINAYIDLLSDASLLTLDKYGPQATILSGELGSVDSVPVIVSEYVRIDLDATGVNGPTAGNNIKTQAITVNRRGIMLGSRRGITVEVLRELYAESDQDLVLASARRALSVAYPNTENVVAYHYNVAK